MSPKFSGHACPQLELGGIKAFWHVCSSNQAFLPNSTDAIKLQSWASLETDTAKKLSPPNCYEKSTVKSFQSQGIES